MPKGSLFSTAFEKDLEGQYQPLINLPEYTQVTGHVVVTENK